MKPPDKNNVVYRFFPTEEERKNYDWAEEYVVVRFNYSSFSHRYFARDGERWSENEYFSRAIIAHLLQQLESISKAHLVINEKLNIAIEMLERLKDMG